MFGMLDAMAWLVLPNVPQEGTVVETVLWNVR